MIKPLLLAAMALSLSACGPMYISDDGEGYSSTIMHYGHPYVGDTVVVHDRSSYWDNSGFWNRVFRKQPRVRVSGGGHPPRVRIGGGGHPPRVRIGGGLPRPPHVRIGGGSPPPRVRIGGGSPPPRVRIGGGSPPPRVRIGGGSPPPRVRIGGGSRPPPRVRVNRARPHYNPLPRVRVGGSVPHPAPAKAAAPKRKIRVSGNAFSAMFRK